MLPKNFASARGLWNAVEAAEKRKDAQLAREVEFAIPREMTQEQGIELARDFVQARVRGSRHDRRSQCPLGHRRGRRSPSPMPMSC